MQPEEAASCGSYGHEVQARSSGGERYLDTVEVSGSNPLAPTIPESSPPGPTPPVRGAGRECTPTERL